MNFGESHVTVAMAVLSTIPFFPADDMARSAVSAELKAMCPSLEALQWLIGEAKKLKAWPGLGELRGILCTHYAPADGDDADCSLPGYRPSDGERLYEAAHMEHSKPLALNGAMADLFIEGGCVRAPVSADPDLDALSLKLAAAKSKWGRR